jgi:hypothetical protein
VAEGRLRCNRAAEPLMPLQRAQMLEPRAHRLCLHCDECTRHMVATVAAREVRRASREPDGRAYRQAAMIKPRAPVWGSARESAYILLEGAPEGLNSEQVEAALRAAVPQLEGIHDLHSRSLADERGMVTLHARIKDGADSDHCVRETTHRPEPARTECSIQATARVQ